MKKLLPILILLFASCANQQDKNSAAIHTRINAFMMNPENMLDLSNYRALEFSKVDTLLSGEKTKDRAYKVEFLYQGLNSASRNVKRTAAAYFNRGFEVVEVKNLEYLDAMSKEEYKGLGKKKD